MSPKSWGEVWQNGPGPQNTKEMVILFLKGMLMGMADLVPGVSGGTVAFVTGIYEDLLESIASINKNFFINLISFQFKEAFFELHLRILIPLFTGIVLAIFSLARVMHFLMNEHPVPTWGAFLGLIFASLFVIAGKIERLLAVKTLFFISLGTCLGYVAVSLIPVTTPYDKWFIFLCGIIGVTAMILPGLSGSFLLLILGKYEYITEIVKAPFAEGNLLILGTFVCGTVSGLLGFSKALNYCMKHFHNQTMALLTGILIGTLKKVWPWKEVLESKVVRGKLRILKEVNIFPTEFDNEVLLTVCLMIIGFIVVIMLERASRLKKCKK